MLLKLTLLQFEFQIQLHSFEWNVKSKKTFAEAITR
jgi:hypothetical protein